MSKKHTPGKWVHYPVRVGAPAKIDRYVVASDEGYLIARTHRADEMALADARLIAKAPELFEMMCFLHDTLVVILNHYSIESEIAEKALVDAQILAIQAMNGNTLEAESKEE